MNNETDPAETAERCWTVARADNSSTRGYSYWAAVEYIAQARKSDGVRLGTPVA